MNSEEKISSKIPTVSVIMSCYQEPLWQVRESVESILEQTFTDFEFIIILDDPSNENLEKLLHEYKEKDSRIRIIVQSERRGLAAGRNSGIETSRGEYVAMMDADDVSMPSRLEKQLEWIKTHDCDLVFSHMQYISEEGKNLGCFRPTLKRRSIMKDFLLKHIFAHPTVLIRREVFKENRYDEGFIKGQDTDLWMRLLLQNFNFCIMPEMLFMCRLHRQQTSIQKRVERQIGYAKYGVKFVGKHWKKLWATPPFWLFSAKSMGYFVLLNLLPDKIIYKLMRLKDYWRSAKSKGKL